MLIFDKKVLSSKEYWLNRIKGLESHGIDFDEKHAENIVKKIHTIKIEKAYYDKILNISKNSKELTFIYLLSIINICFMKYKSGITNLVLTSQIKNSEENIIIPQEKLTYNISFKEFLGEVRTNLQKVFLHSDYPLINLIKDFNDLDFSSLCHTKILYDGIHRINLKSQLDTPLLIVFHEEDKHLYMSLQYDSPLYSDLTIERLSKHIKKIFNTVVNEPNIKLSEIEITSETEKKKIINDFNDTKVAYPKEKMIHQFFEEKATLSPESKAVIFGNDSMTYSEMNKKSNQIARQLRKLGLKEGEKVGVIMERSFEMLASLLGIMKSGGAYVPIDPTYPEERLNYIIEDSNVEFILTQKHIQMKGSLVNCDFKGQMLVINKEISPVEDGSNLSLTLNSSNLAYVIYTSGTTGYPKGAMIKHLSVVNRINWMARKYEFNRDDVFLQKTPYVFDVSVWELFGWFFVGAKICIVPSGVEKDAERLTNIISENKITIIHFVPSMLNSFLGLLKADEHRLKKMESLSKVFCSGEALSPNHIKQFSETLSLIDTKIINLYGPTEATVDVSYYDSDVLIDQKKNNIPIGKPIDNTQLYILDKFSKVQPIGVRGELYISGDGLGEGYLNKPELTAEKFIDHPYLSGQKIYKTGDFARWLPDGNIEYLGRIDEQVKIRGYRIELMEIENQLLNHPAIEEAAVLIGTDSRGHNYIRAFIVRKNSVEAVELQEFLTNKLPSYMVPTYFDFLKKLPLTINGKLDRKSLLAMQHNINEKKKIVKFNSETEKKLMEIWQDILERTDFDINDSFLDLGGHSIKALELINKVLIKLGIKISFEKLIENQTISKMAKLFEDQIKQEHVKIPVAPERNYYPISSAQNRLFVLQQQQKKNISYNLPNVYYVRNIDSEKLKKSIYEISLRHEILRTNFMKISQVPHQKVHTKPNFSFFHTIATRNDIDARIKNFIVPFDLENDPLLRVELVEVSNDEFYLMFDMHHIITDGISMKIFLEELFSLYTDTAISPVAIQYKDFCVWEKENAHTKYYDDKEKYWLEIFQEPVLPLGLLTDYPRPLSRMSEAGTISFSLNNELLKSIEKLANKYNATVYMVLLTSYFILLHKYTGQEDITVGTPTSGRIHIDTENTMGLFANTLVMRNKVNQNKEFLKSLKEVKKHVLEAFDNQDFPLDKLIERLHINTDSSRNLLFDTMFSFQHTNGDKEKDLGFKRYDFYKRDAKFDLTLSCAYGVTLDFEIEYRKDLFKKETIERLQEHYINILKEVSLNENLKLSEIEMISKTEKQKIINDFNDTKVAYPKEKMIHQFFEEKVTLTPESNAVIFGNDSMTYSEMNIKSNQIARQLQNSGLKEGERVGVIMERSFEMIASLLGIMKSGGAYVPIDPADPEERLNYIIEDSNVKFILTQKHIQIEDSLVKCDFKGQVLEINKEISPVEDGSNLSLTLNSSNLAYVIYTSGTTDYPKGTMIKHLSVVNRINWMARKYEFNRDDVFLQKTPYVFDVSVWELFGWFFVGAKICLVPSGVEKDVERMTNIISANKITIVHFVPSMLNSFLGLLKADEHRLKKMESLSKVFCSGEALSPKHIKQFSETLSLIDTKIINLYGPMEATVDVSYYDSDVLIDQKKNKIPIGKPIDNTQLYILDEFNKVQPIGVRGELYISGDGLGEGYLNKPELTAEKFIDHPYLRGQKIFKTGDFARWLPDGNIEFLGRIDEQGKIRGYRIELMEIENQLLNHTAIKEAAVLIGTDSRGHDYIRAFIVTKNSVEAVELQEFLTNKLPSYMVPTYFDFLKKLPFTINGKLDRKSLLSLEQSINEKKKIVNLNSETEKKLIEIWQDSLDRTDFGINDNFFDLGGHSLKAVQISTRILLDFEVEIEVKDIFSSPTIAILAKKINNTEKVARHTVNLRSYEKENYNELSSAQKRLWFLDQLIENDISNIVPSAMYLEGKINLPTFKTAWDYLVERHSSLRTTFSNIQGHPKSITHREIENYFTFFDLSHFKKSYAENEILRQTKKDQNTPFSLAKGPLIRVKLFKLSNENYYIYLNMHHIITDGWSNGILLKELFEIYDCISNNKIIELKPLLLEYTDYVKWEKEILLSKNLEIEENYWLNELRKPLPRLDLPTDFDRFSVQKYNGDNLHFECSNELYKSLMVLCKENNVSLFMLTISAYLILLRHLTQEDDIIVGFPTAGRSNKELENMVGFFVNTSVIRISFAEIDSIKDLLLQVREKCLNAYSHQAYPFDLLVKKINPEREIDRSSIFSTMFAMQNYPFEKSTSDFKLKNVEVEDKTSRFDISFSVGEAIDNLKFTVTYNTDLFKIETIKDMSEQYLMILEHFEEVLIDNE